MIMSRDIFQWQDNILKGLPVFIKLNENVRMSFGKYKIMVTVEAQDDEIIWKIGQIQSN